MRNDNFGGRGMSAIIWSKWHLRTPERPKGTDIQRWLSKERERKRTYVSLTTAIPSTNKLGPGGIRNAGAWPSIIRFFRRRKL